MGFNSAMFRRLACTALLVCPALLPQQDSATASSEKPSDRLRVMSFNIRYGTAPDGANHWALRREFVAETIRSSRPHLLGVQEALSFQVDYLQAKLPGYQRLGVGRDGGEAGEFSCIFVDTRRLSVTRSGTFWLSETPEVVGTKGWDAALPRICTWAVLHDRETNARFVHLNTHFDHRGKQARERSSHLITSRLDHFPGLPVLLTGDLNAEEGSAAVQELKSKGLRDSFRVLHPDRVPAGTFSGFSGRMTGTKIDYVFVSEQWQVHAAVIDHREVDGRNPSDHYPVTAEISLKTWSPAPLMPVVDGAFWQITSPVDLGDLKGKKQEAVDHAIFQSDDGKWNVWSCIRGTKIGRLLYAWRGDSLEHHNWSPEGVAMRAQADAGESVDGWGGKEWIQAPHVVINKGVHHMFYGGHTTETGECQICLTTSPDGKTFTRHRDGQGRSRVFSGPGEARDPMTIRIGKTWYCYYSGHDKGARAPCKIYARTSQDLYHWSDPIEVCWGGSAGHGNWSAECPFVVEHDGAYYLFRTTSYRTPLTHLYRSSNPLDFGRDNDEKKIGTIAVAAPEIILHDGKQYISSVHDLAGGIQLARLTFVHEDRAHTSQAFERRMTSLWSFEDGTLTGWEASGDAFSHQPTFSDGAKVRKQLTGHAGKFFVGTYEARPNRQTAAGSQQGDTPKGSLRSPAFTLPKGHVSFLIGGGRDPKTTYVALVLSPSGREIRRATGRDSNQMRRVTWDVSTLAGQKAAILIVDNSSDGWGHVNFDDFRVEKQ